MVHEGEHGLQVQLHVDVYIGTGGATDLVAGRGACKGEGRVEVRAVA